jgi:hypothetical protein
VLLGVSATKVFGAGESGCRDDLCGLGLNFRNSAFCIIVSQTKRWPRRQGHIGKKVRAVNIREDNLCSMVDTSRCFTCRDIGCNHYPAIV